MKVTEEFISFLVVIILCLVGIICWQFWSNYEEIEISTLDGATIEVNNRTCTESYELEYDSRGNLLKIVCEN